MKERFFNLPIWDLKKCGYSKKELSELGYIYKYFKDKRFSSGLSLTYLKECGYSVKELRERGYEAEDFHESYSILELIDGGFNLNQLYEDGFDKEEIIKTMYFLMEYKRLNSNIFKFFEFQDKYKKI